MANGLFAGGDGTELNPYLIEDAHDLNAIRNNLTAHYKLINDIDLNVSPYNEGQGWSPISVNSIAYKVQLDGNFYTIDGLYINRGGSEIVGLFGNFYDLTVKNLKIKNANVTGNNNPSILVGRLLSGRSPLLENISIEGSLTTTARDSGLLVGSTSGATLSIKNCSTRGKLIVKNTLTVQNLGYGGLIGGCDRGTLTIENCYTDVDIECHANSIRIGGVIGNGQSSANQNVFMKNCFALGKINAPTTHKGGLVGYGFTNITNSFWDVESTGLTTSPNGGVGLTTQQMKTAQTFIEVSFDTELNEDGSPVWILEDGEYPKLWFEVEIPQNKYLLKSGNKVLTIESDVLIETELVEPLIKNNFEMFGFDSLFSILSKNIENMKLLISPPNDTIVTKVDLRVIPNSQLLLPKRDIIFKRLSKVEDFQIITIPTNTQNTKIVFSVDSGATWKTYNKNELLFEGIDIDNLEEVKTKGMSVETFNSIGLKWDDVIDDNKVRFGYYLEMENIDDVTNIDRLDVTIDMEGSWKSAEQGVDYNYGYGNEKVSIRLYRDGSYKMNYN